MVYYKLLIPTTCRRAEAFLFILEAVGGASFISKTPKIALPPVKITPCEHDKKLEKCERYVKQLMIRGEQVALVALYNENVLPK